jgi:DNA-binding MarR family transcriptional regulator
MLRAHAALTKRLDADLEARHGLPLTSYEVLVRLGEAELGRMRMCDLASAIVLSRSGLTRLVDRLERDGLLVRESCPSDARGAFARLTPHGREVLEAARTTHHAGVRELFLGRLSEEEQRLLGDLWERLSDLT